MEAARPLVYATALLLVVMMLVLNMAAIHVRNGLREKYKGLETMNDATQLILETIGAESAHARFWAPSEDVSGRVAQSVNLFTATVQALTDVTLEFLISR